MADCAAREASVAANGRARDLRDACPRRRAATATRVPDHAQRTRLPLITSIRARRLAMSLLDQVRKLEEQVLNRLRELEPLVREHEQLRAVAERLGVKYSPSPGEASEAEATAATDGERAPRGA